MRKQRDLDRSAESFARSRRRSRLPILTQLFVVTALVVPAITARAEILWRGDFETGDLSQWSKVQSVDPSRLTIVGDPVHQGSYALRVEVRQGDDPINASGNRTEIVRTVPDREGDERWYSWSVLWPEDYPSASTWQLFTQWHHTGNSGSPPLEFYVVGESVHLRVNGSEIVWTQPLERGVWHEFLFHVLWSSDASVGFVELWYDDALVVPLHHAPTMYAGMDNLLKQGLYRNESISQVGVVFHDGMTMATTRQDLTPSSPPPPDAAPPPPDAAPPQPDAASSPPDAALLVDGGQGDASHVPMIAGACALAPGIRKGGVALLATAFLMAWGWRQRRRRVDRRRDPAR